MSEQQIYAVMLKYKSENMLENLAVIRETREIVAALRLEGGSP